MIVIEWHAVARGPTHCSNIFLYARAHTYHKEERVPSRANMPSPIMKAKHVAGKRCMGGRAMIDKITHIRIFTGVRLWSIGVLELYKVLPCE
jgi:hypothetical protein